MNSADHHSTNLTSRGAAHPERPNADVRHRVDDHSLDSVPASERQGWLQLTWGTTGIVTTLVQVFVGATITAVAGFQLALVAGACVMLVGGGLGWAMGRIACETGLSSTAMTRLYGFGPRGAALPSCVFAFMIIGFIAMENLLLYHGFLFWLGWQDTPLLRGAFVGGMCVLWVALTAFGFRAVSRVASVSLIGFLLVLVYMLIAIVADSGQRWSDVFGFPTQFGTDQLALMGIDGTAAKFVFCVNLMIGPAGALAFIDADLGRHARSSRDIAVAAYAGNLMLNVIMMAIGGAIMYAGMSMLAEYYAATEGATPEVARSLAIRSPDHVAAAFIVFGGAIGTLLMVLAQVKAQVLNTYSSSLSLANLFDVTIRWRPGRLVFVVLANVASLLFLAGDLMHWFHGFMTILGVLTTCLAVVVIADHAWTTRDSRAGGARPQSVNWPGVGAVAIGFVAAHWLLSAWVEIEFASAVVVTAVAYWMLRSRAPRAA